MKIKKVNLLIIYRFLKDKTLIEYKKILAKLFGEFSTKLDNRSDSDNGNYLRTVRKSIKSTRKFNNFKRNKNYQDILEHTDFEIGKKYFEILKFRNDHIFENIQLAYINDEIGNAKKFSFDDHYISPSTLRYAKVISDLQNLFGGCPGNNWIEIGVGYGGQALIADQFFKIESYTLVDLKDVLNLTSRYLDHHLLNCELILKTHNELSNRNLYDFVISNYAFSELPRKLQISYVNKVLSKSKKGYLTMNSGIEASARTNNKLTINELRELLPSFEILDEVPNTSPDNYVIVWGHQE